MHANDSKSKYFLAKAKKRIFSRILDFVFVSVIDIIFFFIFFYIDKNNGIDMLLFFFWTLLVFLISLIYFLIIPTFLKKTLFMQFFSIMYLNANLIFIKPDKKSLNFFWLLLKREFLVSLLPNITILFLGILVISLEKEQAKELLYNLVWANSSEKIELKYPTSNLSTLFSAIYSFYFFLLLFFLFETIVNSGGRNFLDSISSVFIIDLKSNDDSKGPSINNFVNKTNYNDLPGEISIESLEEVCDDNN